MKSQQQDIQARGPSAPAEPSKTAQFFAAYFWFILKNVIGWMLILGAFPIGVLLPGPGGLPMFLIGFALVSLPGKRRLTARALRGRQLRLQSSVFYRIGTIVSLLVPLIGVWITSAKYPWLFGPGESTDGVTATQGHPLSFAVIAGLCVLAAAITWLLTRLTLRLANVGLLIIARGRRSVRPWLRRRGINLLPPRRRSRMAATDENEILEIHERHQHRARWVWETAKPWFRRAVGVAVTIAAWVWILDPLADHWHRVRGVFWSISIWRFALATVLLAGTLALFRAMAWRHVLLAAGVSVPAIATLRIWSTIELSRYVPGGFFPLAGRINLTRPYGIDALLCTVTHAVELAVFFLANILVAVGGLVWFAASVLQPHGMILYAALALLPALLLVLHPRVFYRLLGWIMRGMGLPPIEHRLPGTELLGLLGWMMLGVLAQLAAIWLLLGQGDTFDLGPRHIPLVAAAYALGWCVGTIAIWVPAGIGLQELVYVNVLLLAPLGFLGQAFNNSMTYFAMLALMSILLRVWSTAGDLLISAAAFAIEVIHGGPDDFDASAHNPPPPATMTSSR